VSRNPIKKPHQSNRERGRQSDDNKKLSSSESKPARGERIKTGHSEVRDSYHFWFFNQEIFFLR
jgi:hypothetical protein